LKATPPHLPGWKCFNVGILTTRLTLRHSRIVRAYFDAEEGRDSLSHIDGEVHPKWQQWTDEQVVAAGGCCGRFTMRQPGSALAAAQEAVCHHDAGPNNFVFQDGLPVALIDFEFAAPGAVLDDLAYAAWAWCISSKPQRLPVETQVLSCAVRRRLWTRRRRTFGARRRGRRAPGAEHPLVGGTS
jgi:Ser/Thr protein kinase RdoA (MazF antagonist)